MILACLAGCGPHLAELDLVEDVPLPGGETRFDYQDLDPVEGHLIATHMNDGTVLVIDLADDSVVTELPNLPTARGVAVADEVGLILITISPNQVVEIDRSELTEVRRITTGNGPDGVGWDGVDAIVGVSDQHDGALSLLADGGTGAHTAIPVGEETGNVVYDASRRWFWITAVQKDPPDELIAVDPLTGDIEATVGLPGCKGAHGLRIHPDGQSAFVACEGNSELARVDLEGDHAIDLDSTGTGPDVMAMDPDLGWLYVAAESGDLTVFDLNADGVVKIGRQNVGPNAHTVAVDPEAHRVYFPLEQGPVLRVMKPHPR